MRYGERVKHGNVLHILKSEGGGTWCGSRATPVDATPDNSRKVCRACSHNRAANEERARAWKERYR